MAINKINAYYPNIFYSNIRKMPKNKKIGNLAKNEIIAEGYNSKGVKEFSYKSSFDIKI